MAIPRQPSRAKSGKPCPAPAGRADPSRPVRTQKTVRKGERRHAGARRTRRGAARPRSARATSLSGACWSYGQIRAGGAVYAAPPVSAGLTHVELRVGGIVVGNLDLRICPTCAVAVVDYIRVDPPYRRRGFATRAVCGAVARYPASAWSTSPLDDSDEARAFWASVDWPGTLGNPAECPHMRQADQLTP